MKFVNRIQELDFLERKYKEPGAQLIIIYGRRRIGKTETVLQFSKPKPSIYFLSTRSNEKDNIDNFFDALYEYFQNETLLRLEKNWENIFQFLSGNKERLVLVIDEFPYLLESNRAVTSIFQRGWDLYLNKNNIMLILLGSSMSLMESEVLSAKSPLYGRRTGQWRITPLEFTHNREFYPNYTQQEQLYTYSCLGGVPAYLLQFDPSKDFWNNVHDKILSKGEFLFEETDFLLKEELREPKVYSSILKAISQSKTKFSEIMTQTGISKSSLSAYLETLERLDLVVREIPVTETVRSKKGRYFLKDNFFKFWYRYAFPNLRHLESGNSKYVLSKIKSDFNRYMGHSFEGIAIKYLTGTLQRMPFEFTDIGRWWHKEMEIDIVALNEDTEKILFCECKWSELKRKDANRILIDLKEKSTAVKWHKHERSEYFGLIAKKIENKADLRKQGYIAFDLQDMFK
ncbi:MAG: ATP-binding protein [Euryarchaeota archaeon]|nr:ATP-binding protein [Euryarchaeota archaeon]